MTAAVLGLTQLTGCSTYGSNRKPAGYSEKVMEGYFNDPSAFPVSFKYDGEPYRGLGSGFTELSRDVADEENGKRYNVSYAFGDTGLVFTVNAKAYRYYGAYEWTLYIKNTADRISWTISELNACDMYFKGKKPVLRGLSGDLTGLYTPYEVSLRAGDVDQHATSGRPTHEAFPYYNLEHGNGGTFIAIGWPGSWKAYFSYEKGRTHVTAGQYYFESHLEPDEEVRTPLMAFLDYNGTDQLENMNLWREWFIYCNMHRDADGNVIQPSMCFGGGLSGSSTTLLKRIINVYREQNVHLDYFWMDAGWYVNAKGEPCSWPETGTWVMNTRAFPDKLAEVSDLMHENGGKTMLWFEAEVVRCNVDDFLAGEPDFKKEWMLGTAAYGSWLQGELLDLGNPELREWLLNRIFKVMDEGHIDMFRSDFNVDPAPVWHMCDMFDREGITENKYVQGYLEFLDALLEHYPDMASFDSCASGGGRNDLETLRRGVMLHVSDFWDGNTGGYEERQAVALSLASWIPYFKLEMNASVEATAYRYRSCIAPWMNFDVALFSKDTDWDLVRRTYSEWQAVASLCYSDFYPLTGYSKGTDAWRAWEYYDDARLFGTVSAFRGPDNTESSLTVRLHGLNAGTKYRIWDNEGRFDTVISGRKLMDSGLRLELEAGGSAVLFLEAVK